MKKTQNEMHEIKNKRRPRAVKNKKEGLHLHAKKRMSRTSKAIVTLCSVLVLVLGVYGIGSAFFKDAQRNTVDLNYGSPSVPVEEGEVYSLSAGYAPVDVFARLNWKFSRQSQWYAEMHGTVDTVIQQSITTYKQYENGILISADLTESSLIKSASQFCYLKEKDRVMWRKPASKNYDGLNTEWQTGAPYNIMTIGGEHGFKATNGLPAYELSVYVIEEDTVANTSAVTMTEDGKFKITYDLKPETWQEEVNGVLTTKGATAYYVNQMIFTGGLTTPPEFNAISVTFTFDENWQVFQTDIEEKYSAKYGPIAAPCVSTSTTKYEYNTEKAHSGAYEEYFYQYAEGEVNNGPVEKEITALDCLAEGFGSVLTEPTVLDLDLKIGDTPYHGIVDLDLSKTDFTALDLSALTAKVKLGPLSLWVEEGNAYLNYGGLKLSLKIDELVALVKDLTTEKDGGQAEEGEEPDLLSALADGEFTIADGKAELHSVLPLLGLNIPVDFYFTIGENHEIAVEKVTANISVGDSLAIGAQVGFGKEHLPALSASEKAEYVPLMPYVNELMELFTANVLHADISYKGEGIAVSGGLDLRLNELALAGEVQVDVSLDGIELSKKVKLSYTDGVLYLDLDGIKIQATVEEGIALLEQYVALPELPDADALSGFDLGALINILLSDDFAGLFSSSEENGLRLAVKGSELLSAFGVDFALGDVMVAVKDGRLSAAALGAEMGLTAGTDVALDTQGYTSILPYVQTLIELFSNENLAISVSYTAGDFTVAGEIMLNLASKKAAGEVVLGYRSAQKTLSVIYGEDFVYLGVEGMQIKAGVSDAVALISSLTGAENDLDAKALINQLLALDFGSVISLGEENDTLSLAIAGTELLNALGIEFELGGVEVAITQSGTITVKALDATIEVSQGTPFTADTTCYIDIVKYAETIATMIESGYLSADVSYTSGKLSVTGKIDLALETLEVQGTLTLTYGEASQDINIIYGENVVYLEVGGMKISANVNEAVALIGRFVELPAGDSRERDLIEELLSLDFEQVFTLTEENDTLSLAIAGTELLSALGIEFELGGVEVAITQSGTITVKALGATIEVSQGTPFTADTTGYIDIVDYAETIATMIENGYLSADVTYTSGKLTVTGKIELALETLEVQGTLTLTYGKAHQDINIIYGENVVYLELGGMKISANVNDAVALIGRFVNLPAGDSQERDLIEELLSLDFEQAFTLAEEGDTLSLAIAGTELLHALGIEFELGGVEVAITQSGMITVKALDATIEVSQGTPFTAETTGYIDIVQYAETIATMIESGYLSADVTYTSGKLSVTGKIELALETLEVQGSLTLTYGEASQDVNIIYGENVVYLEVGGMKISAGINEAIALIGRFIELPAGDNQERDLIEELLSLDFTQVFTLTEENDTLSLAIAGTELLNALGIEFDLKTVTLSVDSESIKAEAFGAKVTVKAGKPFTAETDGYIDIVDYANTIATMIESGYLSADVSYTSGKLSVTGKIELALETLEVQGTLTLTYGEASQDINIIYGENVVYLEVGGMKISAGVKEAVALIGRFVELPAGDSKERDLIEELLSLDFSEVFTLTEQGDTLSLAIAGTELLNALGIEFELGGVEVAITQSGTITVKALGATIEVSQGTPFTAETTGYIDIVQYAETIATMIESGYLSADVTYTSGKLSVTGKIELALETLEVQGSLTLTYGEASQDVNIIYGENVVYLEVGGMKISAGINEAVALIGRFIELPAGDNQERDLIEELLSLNFSEVFTLTEEDDTLSLAIAGTELLNVLGVEFELGKVRLSVDSESIKAEALGAEITVKAGTSFIADTTCYIDIVKYAETIATMIESGYLSADVSYTSGKLSVTGKIDLALETLEVQGTLTLTYGEASQDINIIYGENVVYLEVGGMKISAGINEAVALIGRFVELPAGDSQERDLIEELLSLNFSEVFTLTEEDDTLSLAIAGTELLHALGVEFKLGKVTLSVDSESIKAEVEDLGAEITVKAGKPFTAETTGYIDIVQYAETIATMIESGYLSANVSYTSGKLSVTGKIELALETLEVQGSLTLTYGKASQDINIIYGENVVYLEVGGMKISAGINEAVALIGRFIDLPAGDSQGRDLIEELLSLDFSEVFTLTEENDTLSLAIAGTELLNALVVEFELGDVEVAITQSGTITVKALGAALEISQGTPFETNTDNYIDIVKYANTIATMIESGYLSANVSYTSGKLSVTGKIELALETLEVQGKLTLTYGKASQDINIIYGGETVYLELGGMKVSANVNEAVALIGRFVELPAGDSQERDLIEELLSLNFEKVFTLTEQGDTLSLAIAGTELLHALGVEFKLGKVTLSVDSESIKAEVEDLGAEITVKAGKPFTADTTGYIDIVKYADTIATMIESGCLSANVSYTSGKLSVTGKIELALETLEVQGKLTLTYGKASQDINIIYGENVVYLEVGGMKIRANIEEAVALIGRFVELPAGDSKERDLIEELLSMDFSEVFTLTEENDTLSLAIAGTELLHALGIEFELGGVEVAITQSGTITVKALGATLEVSQGKPFTAETTGYIDIVQYAETIATMIESGYLSADVTYTSGKLSVSGKIELALETLEVQGKLTLTYGEASQDINIIYGENVVYLEVGGMKISAGVNEAMALIGRFVELPAGDSQERDLIEELLSLDFSEVFTLTEENDTLSLAIAGTELLNALGVEFELGGVEVAITQSGTITVKALDATIEVSQGTPFTADTTCYIDIVKYAETIATMIQSGYLSADVSYTSGKLSVTGKIDLALETLEVQGTLTLTYGEASQDINIIYGENVVYLEVGGMKISAGINDAVALIGRFVELPAGDSQERDLIEELLSLDFSEVFTLTEENDTLSLAIAGTELLSALGIEFDLNTVTLSVDSESIKAEVEDLGAEITVKAGKPFTADTTGYIDIVKYANTIATMIQSGYLSADVSYTSGKLSVTGKIELALETLEVQGNLTLTYGTASQDINIIYGENVVYLEVGGMKISAGVNDAVALIGRFVELPAGDSQERDLIEELLSLDFSEVFTLTEENDTLSLAIAGTELLSALGVDFELGGVEVAITQSGTITVKALDATLEISQGTPFTAETTGYIDIVQYAETIATMIQSGYLSADVSYTSGKLSVTGKIELALETLEVQGTLTLTYGKAHQDINIIYGENVVYLEVGGMKISAGVDEAVALIGRFVDLPAGDSQERDLIEELLSLDFSEVFTLTEENDTLSLAIAGTELLNALGIEFDLKTVTLSVDSESIKAEVEDLGAEITVKAGKPFTADTTGYIDIVQYAETIATMIESGCLSADVTYSAGELNISGKIDVAFDLETATVTVQVQADLTLVYGSGEEALIKQLRVVYAGDTLYLTVFGADDSGDLKVSLNVKEAIALVTALMGVGGDLSEGDSQERDLIEELLSLDFEQVFTLTEEGDTLSLAIAGTELLSALGIEFDLKTVTLSVDSDSIKAEVLGAKVTVKAGAPFAADTEGFFDLTPLLGNIETILADKALALCGDIVLTLNNFEIDVEIENAVLSFEKGIKFYLHAFVFLQKKVKLEVFLSYDNGTVQFACGALGAKIVISELGSLEATLLNVYGNLYSIVGNMLVDNSKNPLPAPDDLKKMLDRTSGDGGSSAPVWTEIVKALTFETTQSNVSVRYGDLLARLFFPSAFGFLGAELSGSLGDPALKLDGTLHLKNAEYVKDESGNVVTDETGKNIVEFPEMPSITYLGTEEFKAIIGYLGSAVDLLNATDLTLTFNGAVTSTDKAYEEFGGVRYNIDASMSTHRGDSTLIHLDVDGKNLWVDTDVFAHASINIEATKKESDNSLFIDLFILDAAPERDANREAVKDNKLDFYVTLSQFGDVNSTAATVAGYDPVRLYAPSDEILTLLSSALPMLGVDVDILNNYMIAKWLSLENVAQLKAFTPFAGKLLGEKAQGIIGSVSALLNSLTGKASGLLDGLFVGESKAAPKEGQDAEAQDVELVSIADYLKSFTIENVKGEEGKEGTTTLSITLNSKALYGIEGLADVQATLIKAQDVENEDKTVTYGKFRELDLLNIYNKNGTVNTSLHGAIDYNEVEPFLPEGEYKTFLGAEKLILALAKSATHVDGQSEGANTYALNKNFYIDGDININVLSKDVKVKMAISVDVDEKGDVGITVHIEYDKESLLVDIFKSAGWVDLTIKNGNVYIKRITNPEDESQKEEIYRMMPFKNFMADILNQVDFIFNFGDTISSTLKNAGGDSGSGGGTGAEAKKDFGTQLATYLTSYNFTEGGGENGGALWKLVITGSALSSVLSNIDIDLTSSGAGVLRGLSASLTVASILHLNADLRYRNPQNVMDHGVTNVADLNVQETLDHAMSQKVNETDWTVTKYLEGQLGSVKYTVGGETIHEQKIVYDMQTKKFYNDLKYPSFEGAPTPPVGYHWEWPKDTPLTPKMEIAAKAVPNTYHFTLKSEYQIEGYDDLGGTFSESGEYTFGETFDLHIGMRVRTDTFVKELVGFKCKEGHFITRLSDWEHFAEEKDLELTAVWQDVEFTITFDVNGTITTRKGIFGETIVLPEGYENAKTGYTFKDWGSDVPATFSEDVENKTFTAQYTPNEYVITFESEHPIADWEGVDFTMQGEKYVATYTFTYDSIFQLCLNIKTEGGAYILTGWKMNGNIYTNNLPNVLEATTFTAIWEEVGVDVYFGDENGTILANLKRNKHVGTHFTAAELPEVPERKGYTGEWDIDLDTYTVPAEGDGEGGKIVIKAKYTPITYVIHQYSLYPLKDCAENGFERIVGEFDSEGVQGNVYYVRTLYYVFGSNQVTLENGTTLANHAEGLKKEGFNFMGFYSERFGKGEPIETINDSTIEKVFEWNVGNSDDFEKQNTIFAHWKNNAITVRFYSDIEGSLMEGFDGQGRFHDVAYYDDKTQIAYAPTATGGGYQLLAWFAQDSASTGGWKMVTDVAEYRVDDNAATNSDKAYDVALYAVWIKTIKLQITEFTQKDIVVGYHYNIHGTVEGGLPYPGKSRDIYEAIGVNKETTGVYVLHGRGNKSDKLLFGRQVTVTPKEDDANIGTFGEDDMNTATFGTKLTDQADFGGMVMQMKFTFGSASVSMVDAAVISMNTYTVTYHSQSGEILGTVDGVHINYTGTYNSSFFDNKFAINGNLSSSAQPYADELAASNNIICPQTGEEGRTYIWPHREITGNMDIYPVYVTELKEVTFRADTSLDPEKWEAEYDGSQPTGKYVFKTRLYLESTVTYSDNTGVIGTDVISVDKDIYDLPASNTIHSIGKRKGKWGPTSFYYDPYGSTFTAEYGEDTVVYMSAINFNLEYEGVSYQLDAYNEYSVTYQSEYTLWTPTSDGYTFLGWYTKGTDGKWTKVDTLELAEDSATTNVEALWMTNFSVSGSGSRRWDWGKYCYTATINVTGGKLTGAMASEAQISMTYKHFVNNGAAAVGDNDMGYLITEQTFGVYTASHSINDAQKDKKNYYHCVVILTYTYNGEKLIELRESVTSGKF